MAIRWTLRLLKSSARHLKEVCRCADSLPYPTYSMTYPAAIQAKASRRRPTTPEKELFTPQEFEWFSKNAYNLSLKHCTELEPQILTRLLDSCIQVRLPCPFYSLLTVFSSSISWMSTTNPKCVPRYPFDWCSVTFSLLVHTPLLLAVKTMCRFLYVLSPTTWCDRLKWLILIAPTLSRCPAP